MRALVILVLSVLAGVAIATTTPQSSGSISIYAPWAGAIVYTGQSYTINYSTNFASSSSSCTISYQASGDIFWTQITAYGSVLTGSYYWYVPSYFSTGSYRIQIQDNAVGSTAYGTSDYFTVESTNTTALAVGWIVFIVIAVFLCIACGVCVQYRRRQAWYAANNRYALMSGTTTTTVITIPPQQQGMPQAAPGTNPPMIYAPDNTQQQYNPQQYNAPQYAPQQQPQYGAYQQQPVAYGMAPPMYAPQPVVAAQYAPPPAYAPSSTSGNVGGQLNMTPSN